MRACSAQAAQAAAGTDGCCRAICWRELTLGERCMIDVGGVEK